MEYNSYRYVGWDGNTDLCRAKFFSKEIVNLISRKVTELTEGVDKKNRLILVPDDTIKQVMDGVYQSFTPTVGDIHSRYIISDNEQTDTLTTMIDQTIEIIVSNVRNTIGIEQHNESLSTWVQVYGDFNKHGLRAHPTIYTREKRPDTMQFNMNY